ncbi:MAG: tRNA (adenosine(37)-N6)-dimethylallyltransferase MiaA [Lachnospiraceae bacterium]|nr:tRNA (adenosine(37)-N6)-dimethylallyltransferase MiaA [Lachnospiraceae bacterium]
MNKLVILTGPTSVGKTGLSVKLAKKLDGEIISADSMQVYKHMDIGTAKITEKEMDGVRHHLIDVLEPVEEYNVSRFKEEAEAAIRDIYARGSLPIIAGGTGFYIQALLYDVDFSDTAQTGYRKELIMTAEREGGRVLHDMLKKCDEKAASYIHPNDIKRLTRALEYYHETGMKISEHNEEARKKESPYDFRYFVLNIPRDELYKNIDRRVDDMIKMGLVDEVLRLKEMGLDESYVSMKGLGYKEILRYLDKEISLDEAVRIVKRDTRHFAKRQLTWFKRERDCIWINKDEYGYDDDRIMDFMMSCIDSSSAGGA